MRKLCTGLCFDNTLQVGIASGATTIKRASVWNIESCFFAQAKREAWVGDKGAAKSDQVGSVRQRLIGQCGGKAVVHDPGTLAVGVAVNDA